MSPQKLYFYTFKLLCCWFVKHYNCICINGAGWGKIFECDTVSGFYGSLISSHLKSRIKWFSCMDTCVELETLWTCDRSPQDAAGHKSSLVNALYIWKEFLFFCFLLFLIQGRIKHVDYFKILQPISKRQFWFRLQSVHAVPSVLKRNKGYFSDYFLNYCTNYLKAIEKEPFWINGWKIALNYSHY